MGINIQIKAANFFKPSSVTRIQSKNLALFPSVTEEESARPKVLPWTSQFSINQSTFKFINSFGMSLSMRRFHKYHLLSLL